MMEPYQNHQTMFDLGRLMATPGALSTLESADVRNALRRHRRGDWGEVSPEDREANDRSLRKGRRLLSAYTDRHGTRFWIITEADRSVTTVLLPHEY
jgi:hypothetical protein